MKTSQMIIFVLIFSLSINQFCESAKLIRIEKKLCRDLRNCQLYFPCKYFFGDDVYRQDLIKTCPSNYVFNEEKQKCCKAETVEELECIFLNEYLEESNVNTSLSKTGAIFDNKEEELENINRKIEIKVRNLKENSLANESLSNSKENNKKNKKTNHDEDYYEEDNIQGSDNAYEDIEYDEKEYKQMCVVTNWSQFRQGRGRFQFEFIDPNLCTHVIYASVRIGEAEFDETDPDFDPNAEEYIIKSVQHNDLQLFSRLHAIRSKQPSLKLILRVTDDNGIYFSKLSKTFDTRSSFVSNVIEYLEENKFDGIEIEWRWPTGPSGSPSDKENLSNLLKDFRQKIGEKYILGIIMSPLIDRIQSSYQLLDINNNVDYVNVETFDYYGPWDKKTGIMSPLGKMNEQFLFEAFMNIEGTISFLKEQGLNNDKIVLGLASYSRSHNLQHPLANQINALTVGGGFSGSFTKTNGMLSYYETCECFKKGNWKEKWQDLASAPYSYNEKEWVSFENEESLRKKIEFVKSNDLAGASVYSIDMDDFRGLFCNKGPYPFLRYSLGLLSRDRKIVTSSTHKYDSQTTSIKTTIKSVIKTTTPIKTKINNTSKKIISAVTKSNRMISKKLFTTKKSVETKLISYSTKTIKDSYNSKLDERKQTFSYILITPPTTDKINTKSNIKSNGFENKASSQTFDKLKQEFEKNKHEKKQKMQNLISLNPVLLNRNPDKQFKDQDNSLLNRWLDELKNEIKKQDSLSNFINQIHEFQRKQEDNNIINNKQSFYTIEAGLYEPQKNFPSFTTPQLQQKMISSPILVEKIQTIQQQYNYQQASFENKCQSKANGIYRDENDCSSFYICEISTDSRLHKFKCPTGLIFNMNDCTCDWPNQSTPCVIPLVNSFCKETGDFREKFTTMANFPFIMNHPPLIQTQNFLTQAPTVWYGFSCNNREQGLYRDPLDCKKFYFCQTVYNAPSLKHEFICPSGLHFNLNICQCDWPNSQSCEIINGMLYPCQRSR